MKLTATFIKDLIPAGSDYANKEDLSDSVPWVREQVWKLQERINNRARQEGWLDNLNRGAFRKGTIVEVLEIYNNLDRENPSSMPLIPGIVAIIEGSNWDGEIVRECVTIDHLDIGFGFEDSEKPGSIGILEAFAKWIAKQEENPSQ